MKLGINRTRFSSFRLHPLSLASLSAQLFLLVTALVPTHRAVAVDRIRIAVSNPNMPNLTAQMAQQHRREIGIASRGEDREAVPKQPEREARWPLLEPGARPPGMSRWRSRASRTNR